MATADGSVVVVTGGCGFIGAHLVRRLVADGRQVRVLDDLSSGDVSRLPAGVEFRRGDVADPDFIRAGVAGASVVFHLAAVASVVQSNERWLASHITNSGGSVAVMEAVRDVAPAAGFVYASSAAVYGDIPLEPGKRIAETDATRPLGPYGVDKLGTELHAGVAGSLFGLRSFGLRLFNVFGPGQAPDSPYSGVISRFVAQARSGGPITVFGDGQQTRDFVHVDDVVAALLLAEMSASAKAPVVNICAGVPTSVNELAAAIAGKFVPAPRIVHMEARRGDIKRSLGDPSLAARLLDWEPGVTLDEGLTALIASNVAGAG
ncbi:MAG: NAD-dependent epimerase/dehydratase family protein [Candidatus Limnocylindrales bacterium]